MSLFNYMYNIIIFSPGYKVHKCVGLLETFLQDHKLDVLLWTQCTQVSAVHSTSPPGGGSGDHRLRLDPFILQKWQELIVLIATLPERITNKMQKETRLVKSSVIEENKIDNIFV